MTDTTNDAAAVEAVARILWTIDGECQQHNYRGYSRDAAEVIAAMRALGWVDGQRHAIGGDACATLTATYVAITRERIDAHVDAKARLVQRINNLERGLATTISERDALEYALEACMDALHEDGTTDTATALRTARAALATLKDTP